MNNELIKQIIESNEVKLDVNHLIKQVINSKIGNNEKTIYEQYLEDKELELTERYLNTQQLEDIKNNLQDINGKFDEAINTKEITVAREVILDSSSQDWLRGELIGLGNYVIVGFAIVMFVNFCLGQLMKFLGFN